ncbi:DUF3320 domain-containing protein [Pokkaliibacter sp. CJK22405]|uniref:DUF3320 domain-containing protein n=1 Tax=Pokkaliibacter sp. CJK22405 TaxID=3384615 RepID=UPI0039849B9F
MTDNQTLAQSESAVSVKFVTTAKVNFASSQNGISIVKHLSLQNISSEPIENITVTVSCLPDIISQKSWTIDRIKPDESFELYDLETHLNASLLKSLNEAERGDLTLTIKQQDQVLYSEVRPINLLARDEWGGMGDMDHLLAAYVAPNDSAVAAILKKAATLLEENGHDGFLDGYQSRKPERVWKVAAAIWSVISSLNLTYAVPPASFEREGQKIRDPQRIHSEGLATCLDSTLLMAACFEAAGLNTVALFSKGHAWVGLWLIQRDFGALREPDVMTVRKAVVARELILLETTLVTKRPAISFAMAIEEGKAHVSEQKEHLFEAAIDISRARAAGIKPLSQSTEKISTAVEVAQTEATISALPEFPEDWLAPDLDTGDEEASTPQDRVSRWQRKLLDLSLRNRLLNFSDSKQTLPFDCPMVSELEDQLANGKKFKVFALKGEDPIGQRDQLAQKEPQIVEGIVRDAFSRGQVSVPLTKQETTRRLTELYRKAKSDMQEGGTNTLFLAAGFLRWRKTEGDKRTYRAPLLLLPVKLDRKSAQSEYVIMNHEDDIRFNSTLLELLKRDFALHIPELEGELPKDQSGYDLPLIFDIMRKKVRDVAGFEVVEELAMSTFSFAKFLMWKDLVERTDSLRESAVVRHLVDSPSEPFLSADAGGLPEAVDVDRRIAPKDLFTPLPADSSQLAAVLAAQEGHNFVLIGPPGTGKSQTIANIISQCLAIGKTVLFVAEKSAALDVVQRRLNAHGLGDAVLELHSNKSDRKAVIAQLERSWKRASHSPQNEWIKVTDNLTVTRAQLNGYVDSLHKKGTQGFSVFEAIGLTRYTPSFQLSFANKDAHDEVSYEKLNQLAEELGRCFSIVSESPELTLIEKAEWSFDWDAKLRAQLQPLKKSTETLKKTASQLVLLSGLSGDEDISPALLERLNALAQLPLRGDDVSAALSLPLNTLKDDVTELCDLIQKYQSNRDKLSGQYAMDKLQAIPLERMDADWRIAQTKMWPFSVFAKSSVRKLLQTYATAGKAAPETDITALTEAKELQEKIEAHSLRNIPPCKGYESDVARISAWVEHAHTVCSLLNKLSGYVGDQNQWAATRQLIASGSDGELVDAIEGFSTVYQQWNSLAKAFEETANSDPSQLSLQELILSLEETSDSIAKDRSLLEHWTRWIEVSNRAIAVGLEPLVEALENDGVADTPQAFAAAYATWWLPLAMDADDALRGFAHWQHEDLITKFRELDDQAMSMAADQVMLRLKHGLPSMDAVSRRSELGTLRHQAGLQRPSMPIRTLIAEMPDTFSKLAPCVLMSPLSVAQYLPANRAAFDVVIFDEASQITTWDAIGAIARGKQAIIVGDPKQLPPTNFFGRAETSEDDIPEVEKDLASILDEVVAAGIPTRQLNWHYRSRDESLIAFSNWHYYGGRLVTFPGPTTSPSAVQLHQIDGVYGRGKGRTNESEANAIVKMIVGKLQEWSKLPEKERLTLGVITFNVQQQELILDLLDDERRKNPALEWFFEDAREEPVIVKNLENIQGDERDVMLFSITFGHDHAGKLSMAFGALNGDGGEKRLNVAVTRARQELHIFASIHADEIDLTRTNKVGVEHLKNFLDFAARGSVALAAQDSGSLGDVESPFEASVKEALEARGWEARSQIGVSGFRIDLGIVHPDHAGVFLAGVECDGATYHSSATARDRDKVRQAVLEGLGWNILRVWSTDWFKNSTALLERLDSSLKELLERDRAKRKAVQQTNEDNYEQEISNTTVAEENEITEPWQNDIVEASESEEFQYNTEVAVDEPEVASSRAPLIAGVVFDGVPATTPPEIDPDKFYDAAYIPVLESLVDHLVRAEGPLTLASLGRKISGLHGWQRTGRRISEQVNLALGSVDIHSEEGVDFAWSKGSYKTRLEYAHQLDRNLRDISRSEIAWLYDMNAHTLDKSDDSVLDFARLAGISRLSSDARAYLEECLAWREANK